MHRVSSSSSKLTLDGPLSPTSSLPRKASIAPGLSSLNQDNGAFDPEELFTKRTIAEVRIVQRKLRADAGAKQEELRTMVGERYRDLLQASASIISMSRSSAQVLEAIEDLKENVGDLSSIRNTKRSIAAQKDDSQIRTLQSLAAHVRLLLDAPEHLWRFLERRKYLHAGWLFLLAQVVHRSFATEDPYEEEGWYNQGIDTKEQFPLAQRQWETITPFRHQVTHKATLSLREKGLGVTDVCATLLTLHLMDSRPLTETLLVFLAQRTKALQQAIGRKSEASRSSQFVESVDSKKPVSSKTTARDLRRTIEVVLSIIFSTLETARNIFGVSKNSSSPLMGQVLDYVVNDESSAFSNTLPSDLRCSTQMLLSTLPSSSQLILLPSNLRTYKPYIDLGSSPSTIKEDDLTRKLNDWFQSSMDSLLHVLPIWLGSIDRVRHVWTLRTWVQQYVNTSIGLTHEEKVALTTLMNETCQTRIVALWTTVLSQMQQGFKTRLSSVVKTLTENNPDAQAQMLPLSTVFSTSNGLVQPSTTMSETAFNSYRSQLERQIAGRTPLVDEVIVPLEVKARSLKSDLDLIQRSERNESPLVPSLQRVYADEVEKICTAIVEALKETADLGCSSSPDILPPIAFIGKVAHALASSSSFVVDIGIGESAAQEFRGKSAALHTMTTDHWEVHTVALAVSTYCEQVAKGSIGRALLPGSNTSEEAHPSPELLEAVLLLTNTIRDHTAGLDYSMVQDIAKSTLERFIARLEEDIGRQECDYQSVADLSFVGYLADQWGPDLARSQRALESRMTSIRDKFTIGTKTAAVSTVPRYQLLLDVILPLQPSVIAEGATLTPLLPLGIPTVDTQFQQAMDIAKPSTRFGLLLVGTAAL